MPDLEPYLKMIDEMNEKSKEEFYKKTIENIDKHMISFSVPPRFITAKISDFGNKYKSLHEKGKSLYLLGQRGVGKTHLMAAILKQFLIENIDYAYYEEQFYGLPRTQTFKVFVDSLSPWYKKEDKIFFIQVPELLLEIRSTFKQNSEKTEEQVLDKYSNAGLLFLDDIGAEKTTDWSLQTLYLLIDRRYRDMLRTIISSNLTLDELAEKLDDRIASRIAGMCEIVEIKGKDRRLSKCQ